MARPKTELDYKTIEGLAQIQCTQDEIANVLNVSVRTLQRDEKFCHLYKKGIENGKASLRRLQWKSAQSGDRTMLIWLGKQYLNQKDNIDKDITIDIENSKTLADLLGFGKNE